jgi:hypothetical protein
MTATFNDLYTPLSTRKPLPWTLVSLRTREVVEISYSIGTQDMKENNGRLGLSTWTAVKGETYKLRVQHMPVPALV